MWPRRLISPVCLPATGYFRYLAIRTLIGQTLISTKRACQETWLKSIPIGAPSRDQAPKLLRVRGLSVSYAARGHAFARVLRRLDLEMSAGEVIGILGESGCGKSTLALSILGLLAADAQIDGSILFQDQELLGLPEAQLRKIRGAKISLIHQEPGLALSPVMRVGDQISEVIGAHRRLSRKSGSVPCPADFRCADGLRAPGHLSGHAGLAQSHGVEIAWRKATQCYR
jgi:ABC-type dipeptide/oligopeptide/nickel transport system ATPase component